MLQEPLLIILIFEIINNNNVSSERVVKNKRSHSIIIWGPWFIWVVILILHVLEPCHEGCGWRLIINSTINKIRNECTSLLNWGGIVPGFFSSLDHWKPRVLAFTSRVVCETEGWRVNIIILSWFLNNITRTLFLLLSWNRGVVFLYNIAFLIFEAWGLLDLLTGFRWCAIRFNCISEILIDLYLPLIWHLKQDIAGNLFLKSSKLNMRKTGQFNYSLAGILLFSWRLLLNFKSLTKLSLLWYLTLSFFWSLWGTSTGFNCLKDVLCWHYWDSIFIVLFR